MERTAASDHFYFLHTCVQFQRSTNSACNSLVAAAFPRKATSNGTVPGWMDTCTPQRRWIHMAEISPCCNSAEDHLSTRLLHSAAPGVWFNFVSINFPRQLSRSMMVAARTAGCTRSITRVVSRHLIRFQNCACSLSSSIVYLSSVPLRLKCM